MVWSQADEITGRLYGTVSHASLVLDSAFRNHKSVNISYCPSCSPKYDVSAHNANVIVPNKQCQLVCRLFGEHLDIKRRQTADTNVLVNRTSRMQPGRNWTNFEGWSTENRLFSAMYKGMVRG